MTYRDNSGYFQALKWIQLLFSFLVFILEMIELGATMNYDRKYGADLPRLNLGRDYAKKYIYFVFGLSIFCLALYLVRFQYIWKSQKGPFLWIEISFLALWFSAAMANLDDVFKGQFSNCANIHSFFSEKIIIPQEPFTACNTYIASLIYCWLNTLSFVLSTFISWKIRIEKSAKIQQTRRVKVIKLINDSDNSEMRQATFIRVESHNENREYINGVVEIQIDNKNETP
ncbi:186_t:CDS:2 [Funneliformis geosporum]|uniref:10476_t:CDS:1 n=1 Tax=Funneliformis geosporum TaxID=1117311 RepID=A0A9W4SHM3_9GLOM|nr:10476_t:CDS:2 [Funneliformis geosporum]CAI2170151.1 186_t:CDS:2 [Funneliformis geosporum]